MTKLPIICHTPFSLGIHNSLRFPVFRYSQQFVGVGKMLATILFVCITFNRHTAQVDLSPTVTLSLSTTASG